MPFAEAVERLDVPAHFGNHVFKQYGEDDRKVRYYEKSASIEGDIDALYYADNVAGIFTKQDLTVNAQGQIEFFRTKLRVSFKFERRLGAPEWEGAATAVS